MKYSCVFVDLYTKGYRGVVLNTCVYLLFTYVINHIAGMREDNISCKCGNLSSAENQLSPEAFWCLDDVRGEGGEARNHQS